MSPGFATRRLWPATERWWFRAEAVYYSGTALTFMALLWCTRMYRAAMHNRVVNQHRRIALETFDASRETAVSELVKNVVLQHAATTIFAPQESGFVGPNPLPQTPSAQILKEAAGKPDRS